MNRCSSDYCKLVLELQVHHLVLLVLVSEFDKKIIVAVYTFLVKHSNH